MGFKLPPGTAGQTPALGLSYEGGAGNGPAGFGWMRRQYGFDGQPRYKRLDVTGGHALRRHLVPGCRDRLVSLAP